MTSLLRTVGLVSSVFTVVFMGVISPVAQAAEIDQAGYEKIVIDPKTGKVIDGLEGMYANALGVLAVFGPEARIVALYSRGAINSDEAMNEKLIGNPAKDEYLSMTKGPFVAAALMGQGRVVAVPVKTWFDKITGKETPEENPFSGISGSDRILVANILRWVSNGKEPSSLNTVMSTDVSETSNLKQMLASADVFIGPVRHLSAAQIDDLIAFVENGGGLFTGDSAAKGVDYYKRGHFSYPIDDQYRYKAFNNRINRLLRKAGLGIAYGLIDQKSSHQSFNTNIPVQWSREYGEEIFDAIDDLHLVDKDRDNRSAKYKMAPDFVPEKPVTEERGRKTAHLEAQEPVVAVATLIGQQIAAMSQVLPEGDPLLAKLDAKLEFLKQPVMFDSGVSVIKGPLQKALCLHEAIRLYNLPPDKMRKSRVADGLLGYPVRPDTPRTQNEPFVLTKHKDEVQITEFYAPAGEVVTLDFSDAPELIGMGYHVHINVENPYNYHSELDFERPPLMQKAFPIDQPVVKIASPVGGIIYIRYTTDEAQAAKAATGHSYDAEAEAMEAEAMMDVSGDEEKLQAQITGAVRYPCFLSGKHDNQDLAHMLENFPGYKIAAICRNVWVDLPRRNAERSGLEDMELWAALFDSSYGKSFEVGPSVSTRTRRLTDFRIPGVEPGYPTRMGRMSTVTLDGAMGDLTKDAGMTAHKVGHYMFGANFAWARALGTHVEFRANQMPAYENYKTGLGPGARGGSEGVSDIRTVTINGKKVEYHAYNPYHIIQTISTYLNTPGHDYFTRPDGVSAEEVHSGKESGVAHGIFLYCKWQYLYDGMNGIDVWAVMNKYFADDCMAARDGDPKTIPRFPLHKGGANVHAQDHIIRWASICSYDLTPYFEVFGFEITDETKNHPLVKKAQPWLPMASPFFNRSKVIRTNEVAVFDFNRTDDKGMTLALTTEAEAVLPEFLGIAGQPAFGRLKETAPDVYTYVPVKDAQGRDSFAYRVRHPETKQEQTFTVYVDVVGPTEILPPDEALRLYGRGALAEVLHVENSETSPEKKKRRRRAATADSAERTIVWKSRIMPQSFKTRLVGDAVRMRTYLEVPEDGEYTFWVRAKGGADLKMNTRGWDPAGASPLPVQADSEGTRPVYLEEGKQYFVELYKPGGGEATVGWSRRANAREPEENIPERYLIPVGKPICIVPVDDVAQTAVDESVIIDALSNDKDYRFADPSDRECLHIHYVGQTENGKTALINNNQQIKYTPNPGFTGTDKFQYGIQSKTYRDGMQVGSVTVSVD